MRKKQVTKELEIDRIRLIKLISTVSKISNNFSLCESESL